MYNAGWVWTMESRCQRAGKKKLIRTMAAGKGLGFVFF